MKLKEMILGNFVSYPKVRKLLVPSGCTKNNVRVMVDFKDRKQG